MATDRYELRDTELESPAIGHVAVTPSDSDDLAQTSRSLYIGTAGNISVVAKDGTDVIYANVPAGTILPVRATRVNSTGTTAGSIVSMY